MGYNNEHRIMEYHEFQRRNRQTKQKAAGVMPAAFAVQARGSIPRREFVSCR
jgi:hypothetical protein